MTVFAGLINTHVIKAPDIRGRMDPTMTHSQEDRSLLAKKNTPGEKRQDVTKCIDTRRPRLRSPDGETQVRQTQPVDTVTANPPSAQTYTREDLRLQRARSNTTNCGVCCIHFIHPMRYFSSGIRRNLILNKSAPLHWRLEDLPKTTSGPAALPALGKDGVLATAGLEPQTDLERAPHQCKAWEIQHEALSLLRESRAANYSISDEHKEFLDHLHR